jgi:hypothetical protein
MANSEDQITAQPETQPTKARPMWSPEAFTVHAGIPASRRTESHPGLAGYTFLKKESRVFLSVSGARKAASSQHTEVKATDMMILTPLRASGLRGPWTRHCVHFSFVSLVRW